MQSFQRLLTFSRRLVTTVTLLMFVFSAIALAESQAPEKRQARGVLADRLIAQINAVSYSQWQLESHLLVKESLRFATDPTGATLREPDLVSASNWDAAIEAFVTEMMVFQEAKRIGSFMPTVRMVDQGCDLFRTATKRSAVLMAASKRLGITDSALRRLVSDVVRVDAFAQSQDRGSKTGTQVVTDRPWIKELRARAIIRRFGAAATWMEIRPSGGQP